MKTLLKNLRYLWRHNLEEDLSITLDDLEVQIKPPVCGTPMSTLFTGKHHVDVLSARAITELSRAGVKTVEQLEMMSEWQIRNIGGIGKKTADYIMTRLYENKGEL